MNDKKDVRVIARQCSNVSSISTRSGTSRSSLGSKGTKDTASTRSIISSSSSTPTLALSHTLSATERFIYPSKRIEPCSIERIDGLKISLLDTSEPGQSKVARLLNGCKDVCSSYRDYDRRKHIEYQMPPIAQALKLEFSVSLPTGATKPSWIHLSSCRRWTNEQVDNFIRACTMRLLQIGDSTHGYIALPPCFYLEKVEFALGITSSCATFAWLGFDASWIDPRKTVKSGLVTAIVGDLELWRGKNSYWAGPSQIQYERKGDGQTVSAEVSPSRIDSSRAFPAWLDARDAEDFVEWCGAPEARGKGDLAYHRNFLVRKIRFNYFGDIVRATLVRAPGAPNSLPERPKAEPVKKKGFLRRQR